MNDRYADGTPRDPNIGLRRMLAVATLLADALEASVRKDQPADLTEKPSADLNPSWGPVGSLERQRWADDGPVGVTPAPAGVAPIVSPPLAQPEAVVARPFPGFKEGDRYNETDLFDCPRCCASEGAKANKPLDLWHCVICNASGKASSLRAPGARAPTRLDSKADSAAGRLIDP